MKIEAVTVCARTPETEGYADFLREVAPLNRALLDRWIVVTSPDDRETKAVCRAHSIECVETRDFDLDPPFAKAQGINRGLHLLRGDGWLLHLDADICLPFDLRQCLRDAQPRKGAIHGALRANVVGWDAWQKLKARGLYSRSNGWLAEYGAGGNGVGASVASQQTGWVPCGYFQFWWGEETLTWGFPRKFYPVEHGNAARTDVQFALQWDRRDRVLIPELVVFHLESEKAKMGANWGGRRTKQFGPGRRPRERQAGEPGGY